MSDITVPVEGMTCQHCVRSVSAAVSDVPGVRSVHVDLAGRAVHVDGSPDLRAVHAAIVDAGYEVG